jgi:hypothetical protein
MATVVTNGSPFPDTTQEILMTGYTVHTGSNQKFSSNWDRIFGKSNVSGTGKRKDKLGGKSTRKKKPAKR